MSKEIDESIDLCTQCLLSWSMREVYDHELDRDNNPELFEEFKLADILKRKMEWAGLDMKVMDELYLILSICSDTPGYIQLLMKELLESIPNLKNGYRITANDFCRIYGDEFPVSNNSKWRDHFSILWDAQKVYNSEKKYNTFSDNNCDSKEWWLEVLKNE